jgi:hypothetical protein
MKEFFKLTKIKIIYLIIIAFIIIISGILSQNVIYCIQAPCIQPLSTTIGQSFYSVFTFGELFINSNVALQFKNLLQPTFSAGTSYLIFSFIISIILHYLLISIIMRMYKYYTSKNKNKKKKSK